ncbi:SGNH/GDSL hydrolase family protein [Staphylococcus pseudintermedius]|nr:SGNH/GDSL hydrolase family protein [Staphylococcus pseudintermedius]
MIKTELPTVLNAEYRKTLESNFKEIKKFMENKSANGDLDETLSTFREELQKEIRAIVLPEESPQAVAFELNESKTDLRKVKHDSFSQRLEADFSHLKEEVKTPGYVVTRNGTVMPDYREHSNIKRINSIAVIGDSVAKGLHASKNFGQYLAEFADATLTNFAVSGATFSTATDNNIVKQADKVRNADLVIVQGTDDDWLKSGGILIGTDSKDTRTFYGAFCTIISKIRRNNPHAKIIVMTATRQLPVTNNTTIRRKDTDVNSLNLKLEDYVNKQVLACTELDLPVFDAYHTTLIDPYNPAYRIKNMLDGLHPNEFAHEVIAHELLKLYDWYYG